MGRKLAEPQEPVPDRKCVVCSGTGKIVVRHGTLGAYNNHKCRCEPCREANRTYVAKYRRVG